MSEKNIIWQETFVTKKQREEKLGQKGMVIWFTGLSGSGKSTIAAILEQLLYHAGYLTYMLDGDNVRHGINRDLGFSREDRQENIRRISEIAALFQDAGIITLVSAISPFRDMRQFARNCCEKGNFIEVYVKADWETCKSRDPKGLYQKNINNFTGKDSAYEVPEQPEILLDTERFSASQCADLVFQYIKERILIK